ncbi:hypothetical protein [Coprobacillus cateniformis]|uniref:hypothetical protein n=2 Tax=Coprobacillus cateniformis TaxID=100884 RepID=UPI003219E914
MQMKKKKKLILLLTICFGMFLSVTGTVKAEDGVEVGNFRIDGGQLNADYRYASGVLTILSDQTLTIKNKNPATATTDRIVIPENVKANLIFAGVNIKTSANSPFTLTPDANGDGKGSMAHIILADSTTNKLVSGAARYPGLRCGETTTLYIDDSIVNKDINGNDIIPELRRIPYDVTLLNGTQLKKGDRLTLLDSPHAGTLTVTGNTFAAGIGGGDAENGGYININGGIVNATTSTGSTTSDGGSGIGGGSRGTGGNITINGGVIMAKGAYHAAGVGGGYHTASTPAVSAISPAVVNSNTGKGKSGNITINGGLTYSNGGTHGDAFGDGCYSYSDSTEYKIIMTGGTVIPNAPSSRFHLGGSQANVFVLGGSLKAERFKSIEGTVAYGDMEKSTKVFMTKISLSSWGTNKVGTTLVDNMDMKINGIDYNYGIPSYTDDAGILYFWLPDTNVGSEVSIDLDVIDKSSGDILNTDTFFAKDVGTPGNVFLKQYVNFEIDGLSHGLITKRYDGKGLDDNQIKNAVAALNIPTTIPLGGSLSDASKLAISSQLLKDDGITPEENAEIVSGSNAGGGKHQLIITSTQYADSTVQGFKDAYWGHRTYFKYAEITPADTKSELTIDGLSEQPDIFRPDQIVTLKAKVSPADGEGIDCASPEGYVQFYINGRKYGNPVKLVSHTKDDPSEYNYSTASIDWKDVDKSYCVPGTRQTVTIEYIGEDRNYNKGSTNETILKIDNLNIDVDGDGTPDINIDTNNDGTPDINIDTDNTGVWKPSSEGGNKDGIWKPDTNMDIKGDGHSEESYYRPAIDIDGDGIDDNWKPNINVEYGEDNFHYDTYNPNINIDTDGDGTPDINIDIDGDGVPDVNIDTNGDNNPDVNVDVDGDGIPDINIDTDGDGKPDINIDRNGDKIPNVNIDTDNTGNWKPSSEGGNKDGIWKPDTNIDTKGSGKGDVDYYRPAIDKDRDGVDDNWKPNTNVSIEDLEYDTHNPNINIDIDGDSKPDINIDTDGDGIPDINIDTNGDNKPDVNIDTNGDRKPDTNIDTDGDGKADSKDYRPAVDKDGDGVDDYWKPEKIVEIGDIKYGTGNPLIKIQVNEKPITSKPEQIKTGDDNFVLGYCILISLSLMAMIYYKRNKKVI